MKNRFVLLLHFLFLGICALQAQMITGVWKGKAGNGLRQGKLELKLIQKGDSLYGTSYYYESAANYRRYTVKGYFNQQTNQVVWWDDELIESKSPKVNILSPGEIPLLMEADFNCPGSGEMMLDGKAVTKEEQKEKGTVHLDKVERNLFTDEWDFVIENYTVGANDPEIIDSIARVHQTVQHPQVVAVTPQPPVQHSSSTVQPKPEPVVVKEKPVARKDTLHTITKVETTPAPEKEPVVAVTKQPDIKEKFIERKKVLTTELPLEGDSIEIHFYDNAEIDGDSISLFMNSKLVFEHVRLTDKPYIVKFATKDLTESNELVMVAENLGSIPPNTSFMIAYINNQRYTANLESTENSSAMIRFVQRQ
ncbi:MAG: hypothetical protein QM725_10340 [Lacibacter sp.]